MTTMLLPSKVGTAQSKPCSANPAWLPPDKTKIYVIDKPGAAQSESRVDYLTALPYDATGDYYRAYISNCMPG